MKEAPGSLVRKLSGGFSFGRFLAKGTGEGARRTESGKVAICPPIMAWAFSQSPRRLGSKGSTGGQNGIINENVRPSRSGSWLKELLLGQMRGEKADRIWESSVLSANRGVGF